MKAILISGYHYNEYVQIVDVKETDKSYMVDGARFAKQEIDESGIISIKRGQGAWGCYSRLYSIDSAYAQSKLDDKRHKVLCGKIENRLNKSITKEQAKAIAEILGL